MELDCTYELRYNGRMFQKTKPGPKGDKPASRAISIRLYPEDFERLDALIADGYAANRTEAIRRSVAETAFSTLKRPSRRP